MRKTWWQSHPPPRSQMATVDIYTRSMSLEARGNKSILGILPYHEPPLRGSSLLLLVYILVDSSIFHEAEQVPVYCIWLLFHSNTVKMGFHRSSKGINIRDKHILTAYCQRPSGESRYSELDLNEFIGAKRGKGNFLGPWPRSDPYPLLLCLTRNWHWHANLGQLAWGSHDFSKSSHDVNFQLEGPENNPILHAQLEDNEGHVRESQMNLADCIKNEDGHLSFMECF